MSGNLTATLLNTTMLLVQVTYVGDFTCYHKKPGVASSEYCRLICSNMARDALATGFRGSFALDISRVVNLSEVFCMIDGGKETYLNTVPLATPPPRAQEHSTLVTSPPLTRSAWTGENTATSLLLPICGLLCLLGAIYWIRRMKRRSRRRREAAQDGDGVELAERIIVGEELAIHVTGEAVVNVTMGTVGPVANGTTAGTIATPGTPGAVAVGARAVPTRVDASTSTDDVVARGGDS
ncbi:uncharacterized protein LOC133355219 isoform X2 [Lethenteron reissneri]|uniref:uncharacterized protein LOC133355219 isoform X2 n=1 Tax=Lethenteron reissneri TaxID=7753 RepID=UPI002AB6FD71|nr:uncharacterized protein LOC133355219 isoform X2 [Lethenteron reissneri]